MSSVNIWLRTAAVERMYPTSIRAPLGALGTQAGRLKPCELVTVSPGDTDPTPPECRQTYLRSKSRRVDGK
jgi:hypothetical protein